MVRATPDLQRSNCLTSYHTTCSAQRWGHQQTQPHMQTTVAVADAEDGVVNLQNEIVDQKEEYDDAIEKLNDAYDRKAK